CQSGLLYPKPCTTLTAKVAFTNLHPPALACWELQGVAATGYRYRNIQDTDRTQKLILISGVLSLHKLKAMKKSAAKTISTFEDRQKAVARAKVEALARNLGYSLAELVGSETKTARSPFLAKYRPPENPALTWSGRGRETWGFIEALEAGSAASELAVR
ncbi:MAG: H-NS histone family protein, partial [Rhizobiaceae bacterium]|nr:H-NS histone family protein [Rhizobiaceae bacterium]